MSTDREGIRLRALRAMGERPIARERNGELVVRPGKGGVSLPSAMVDEMVSEGLLAIVGEGVRRTDAGRIFIRRALSGAADNPAVAQHQMAAPRIVRLNGAPVEVTENAAATPLSWLSHRKDRKGRPMLTVEQREAGERLFCDHERGHQIPPVTASWDPSGVRGSRRRDGLTVSEAVYDARRRVERALAAAGPVLADVLLAVCCHGRGLETVEKVHGWPARSGKVILRVALDRLAAHYGIGKEARGQRTAPMVQWGTPDFRPSA